MDAAAVKQAVEARKAEFEKARMKGSIYETGIIDGLNMALDAIDKCMKSAPPKD